MSIRTALVTGASRGIGTAIARRLAEEGCALTVSARKEPGLVEAAQRLRAETNAEVHAVVANMADEADVRRLAVEHVRRFDGLDLLVLNAGVGSLGAVAGLSMKQFDLTLNVNLRAQFLLIQELLPALRKTAAAAPEHGAKIVGLASISGVAAEPLIGVYGASKAGLISLCEAVTVEESAHGVTACAISPGFVDTGMTAWKRDEVDRRHMLTGNDVAELVVAISRLSINAVVPNIVVTRRGEQIWRA